MTEDLFSAEIRGAIKAAQADVCALHAYLPKSGLVAWTSGNVSARVPGADLMVIKPSGLEYEQLTPESMVVCDLDGNVVEGGYKPSSDTGSHAYVYRNMPEVGGVVHTHSGYATAWAARGSRSRACSPRSRTSSAARSRSARSP